MLSINSLVLALLIRILLIYNLLKALSYTYISYNILSLVNYIYILNSKVAKSTLVK